MQQSWEYHVEMIQGGITPALLNQLGAEGWELAAVVPARDGSNTNYYYFKRLLLQPPAEALAGDRQKR